MSEEEKIAKRQQGTVFWGKITSRVVIGVVLALILLAAVAIVRYGR